MVPVELRRELGLEEGTEMAIRSDGKRLILEPRAEVLRRLRRRFLEGARRARASRTNWRRIGGRRLDGSRGA